MKYQLIQILYLGSKYSIILPSEKRNINNESIFLKEPKDYIESTDLGTPKDKSYATFYLRRSFYTLYTNRVYQKLDDILSYLGGFLNIVVLGIGLGVTIYNKQ